MADRSVDFLLIGGGVAAASCARWLREEGAGGSILLVGREPDPPYNRPPLSKGYLAGTETREDALFRPETWWAEQDVDLLTRTSVMKLHPGERRADLSNREEVSFGQALLATGANVRRLRAPGLDLDGIHYLRAFANSETIREEVRGAERVVLVGGSFIATEVAATLTASHGVSCSLVMMEEVTLERPFGAEVGRFFQGVLEDHGVDVHGGQEIDRFEGSDGRVGKVVTTSGLELECDCVVVGSGVMPDVMLARSAGLELGDSGGIRCSSGLETSAPGIYAAGDVCEYHSPLHDRPLRLEHWDVALEHGRTAALNMLGRGVEHEALPYFFADLADWASVEYVGAGGGDPVIRGSLDSAEFSAFYLDGGRLAAALTVGRPDDLSHARRLIAGRARPDPGVLADVGMDLGLL